MSIKPFSSTFRYVTLKPLCSKFLHVFKTAGCSILDVIMWFPLHLFAYANPLIAKLSLSLPQEVKYTSSSQQFIALATFRLAHSIALYASRPI